jgi:hypothetical protein
MRCSNRAGEVTAWPTGPGSVASPSPAMFATTPAIAAPNAVPIERTEVKADAVLRYSSEDCVGSGFLDSGIS